MNKIIFCKILMQLRIDKCLSLHHYLITIKDKQSSNDVKNKFTNTFLWSQDLTLSLYPFPSFLLLYCNRPNHLFSHPFLRVVFILQECLLILKKSPDITGNRWFLPHKSCAWDNVHWAHINQRLNHLPCKQCLTHTKHNSLNRVHDRRQVIRECEWPAPPGWEQATVPLVCLQPVICYTSAHLWQIAMTSTSK